MADTNIEWTDAVDVYKMIGPAGVLPTRPADHFTTEPLKEGAAMPNQSITPRTREKNHNWRGGRSVASNGYVIVRVGKDHHLADVRGYAYEHRLVAEKMLGRRLKPGEQVHHINEIKTDNRPENLEVVAGIAEHRVRHRKAGSRLRYPDEPNPVVTCECGCGRTFEKYDSGGRPRSFISGHNPHSMNELAQAILYYLEYVPQPTHSQFIASTLGESRERVTATLSRLKARGLVINNKRDWSIRG